MKSEEEEKSVEFKRVDEVVAARKKLEEGIDNIKYFLNDSSKWDEIVEARKKLQQEVGSISSYLRERALARGEVPLSAVEPASSKILRRPLSGKLRSMKKSASLVVAPAPQKQSGHWRSQSESILKAQAKNPVQRQQSAEAKAQKEAADEAKKIEESKRKKQQARHNLLLYDAWEGRVSSLRRYLNECPDLNFRDNDGRTPLHLSAMRNQIQTVKFLMKEAKVDQTLEDCHGYQPLDYAFTNASMNILHYIVREQRAGFPLGWKRQELIKVTKVFEEYHPGLGLDSVQFISTEAFLQFGEIPSYERCLNENAFIKGSDMEDFAFVLFVSCQFDPTKPSENNVYYSMISDFLAQQEEVGIHCLWIAQSCLPCMKVGTDALGMLLATFTSSHFLIVPELSLVKSVRSRDPDGNLLTGMSGYVNHYVSDLNSYLHSGWHQFQLITSLVIGCKVFCCYCLKNNLGHDQIRDFIHVEGAWIERDDYEEKKLSSLQHAAMELKVNRDLWYGFLKDKWYWGIKEPMEIFISCAKCLINLLITRDDLVKVILQMELTEDKAHSHTYIEHKTSDDLSLTKVAEMFGDFSSEEERTSVLQMTMMYLFYLLRHDSLVAKLDVDLSNEQHFLSKQDSSLSQDTSDLNDPLAFDRPATCSYIDINRRKKLPKAESFSSPRKKPETKAKRTGGGFSLADRWGPNGFV